KCLHYYVYWDDDRFGLTQVRLQTWSPFNAHVVLNGREWLARRLDRAGIGYPRRGQTLPPGGGIAPGPGAGRGPGEDTPAGPPAAQVKTPWEAELDRPLRRVLPPRRLWLPEDRYYRTAEQTEWATDLAFRDAATLAALYPQLIRRAIEAFGGEDVLRFLGRRVTAEGHVPAHLRDEVTSDLKRRPEGVRVKHRAGKNTVKLYDKQGSVPRVETTLNEVTGLKSYRAAAGDPGGPPARRPPRKGVAEMPR